MWHHRWYNRLAIGFGLLLLMQGLVAQDKPEPSVLTPDDLIRLVLTRHPVARQADLQIRRGAATRLAARGGFDPKLYADLDQKYFDDKSYFSHLEGGMKVPAWFGAEVKAGFEQYSGSYLNPERTVPAGGLVAAGVNLSLGQGLWIDQRRATLFTARLYQQATVVERQLILNDLLFDATSTYWEWVSAAVGLQVFRNARDLAVTRLDYVRGSFRLGSRAAVDTLEAFLQVQTIDQQIQAAEVTEQQARLAVSNFLWTEDLEPLELAEDVVAPDPQTWVGQIWFNPDSLATWVSRVDLDHPEIRRYDLKLATLDVDRRLKAEKLKPRINVQYNLLTEAVGSDLVSQISPDNYKWGVEFAMPLFLRKERGDLQMARIKIEEARLGRDQKTLELRNKVRAYAMEQTNLAGQVDLLEQTVTNYRRMLNAEQTRFENGESSLFLVNSRQLKLIDVELKLVQTRVKFQKTGFALRWALGIGWMGN